MKYVLYALILMVSAALLAACSTSASNSNQTLRLAQPSSGGLEPLAGGLLYEGWAIIDGQPISTGKFNIGSNGNIVDAQGNTISNGDFSVGRDLSSASDIVISIEPSNDTDAGPSATKVLSGQVNNASSDISLTTAGQLGSFANAAGTYILATPTDGDGTNNEDSGVWFLAPTDPKSASLTLPDLPKGDGWAYEGWIVVNGTPISTGRFITASSADSSAAFSGATAGPPFPGEDLLNNAPAGLSFPVNLRDTDSTTAGNQPATVVISIEPQPDDSAAPFTLKPLVGDVPATGNGTLAQNLDSFPSLTAKIH